MAKSTKINTELTKLLQLVSEESVIKEFGESAASVSKDRIVTWAKFILTDDKPNANRERVPFEEFDNIVATGAFKPVKMAIGEINDGHDGAEPIGVITHLSKDGNKIVALAALWDTERSDDVQILKDKINSGGTVNVSWEIFYGDKRVNEGITDLLDTTLRAVTVVGLPAYAGRTPFLAIAAKRWSPAYISELPDTHFLYVSDGNRLFAFRDDTGKIDPKRFPELLEEISQSQLPENLKKTFRHQIKKLNSAIASDSDLSELLGAVDDVNMEEELDTKELENRVTDLETKLAQANDQLASKVAELESAKTEAQTALDNVKALEEEIAPLREFKQTAEAEELRANKLSEIKQRFATNGIEKPEDYFEANAEKLLALDENGLEFMLQEMVAFNSANGNGNSVASKTPAVPNLKGEGGNPSVSDLAKALRERNKK